MIELSIENHKRTKKNQNMNVNNKDLMQFLKESKQAGKTFYGIRRDSKTFKIRAISEGLIIIEYDSNPKHYVLEFEVLLDGIVKALNKEIEIHLTSDYASKIEFSSINRSGTNNKTSALTKFYYSIHRAFLKNYKNSSDKK